MTDKARTIIRRAALAIVAVTAVATAARLLGRQPFLELTTHFPLQYAIAAFLAFALLIAARSRWALAAVLVAAINGAYIAPYLPMASSAPRPGQAIRVMVLNVYYPSTNVDGVLETIDQESPDVVTLQEITWSWWESLEPRLSAAYPYVKSEPGPAGAGIVLLSRFPMESAEVLRFTSWTQPSIFAVLAVGDRKLSVLCLHPHKPTKTPNFGARNRQLQMAAGVMASTQGPRVLMGDLNCSPWSPYFADLVESSGMKDARRGRGLLATWPLPMPAAARIPIDHVLVSSEVDVAGIHTRCNAGSDHCALVADLVLVQ